MGISRINPHSIDRTQLSPSSGSRVGEKPLYFEERFDFSDIEPEAYKNIATDEARLQLASVLRQLLRKCLQLGLNIRYSKKKKMGDFVLEARFEVKKTATSVDTSMYIPVYLTEDIIAKSYYTNLALDNCLEQLVNEALQQYDNEELVKLLVVIAHEFGHFMSYNQGNHDGELQMGLELMYSRNIQDRGKFTYLVFAEEAKAWEYAKTWLEKFEFDYWLIFDKVKANSLEAYTSLLKLNEAALDVCIKLSFISEYREIASKKSNYTNLEKNRS